MSRLLNGGDRGGEGLEVGVEVEVEAEGLRQRNRTRNSDSVATSWPQASISLVPSSEYRRIIQSSVPAAI